MEKRKYWYKTDTYLCPPCGKEETYKYRVYGEKPKDPAERYTYKEVYDYCEL